MIGWRLISEHPNSEATLCSLFEFTFCRAAKERMSMTDRKGLNKFEKLIRDAIALLIKRGEIKISRKKPRPSPAKQQKRRLRPGRKA